MKNFLATGLSFLFCIVIMAQNCGTLEMHPEKFLALPRIVDTNYLESQRKVIDKYFDVKFSYNKSLDENDIYFRVPVHFTLFQ